MLSGIGPLRWLAPLGEAGWVGVDLFFVLSGYLITGILLNTVGKPHYYRNFITRRTLRIFPLYYVALVLFTAAVRFSGSPALWQSLKAWGGPGWFLFYAGNFRAAYMNAFPPVFSFGPLWSLQVEEQFYLLYPGIVALLPARVLWRLLIGCAIAAPLMRTAIALFLPEGSLACYVLTPCRMDALALGGLVAIMIRTGRPRLSLAALYRAILVGGVAVVTMLVAVSGSAHHPFMHSLRGFTWTVIPITWRNRHTGRWGAGTCLSASTSGSRSISAGAIIRRRARERWRGHCAESS